MPRARRMPRGCALLTAVALLVAGAGCSQGQESVDAPPDDARTDDDVPSLEAYVRAIWGEDDTEDLYQNPTRVPAEELVAACMAEAGFEYHPLVEQPTYVHISKALPVTLDVAEELGYGITIEAGGPGTGTQAWWAPRQESQAERDNRVYVESLSPAARAEYERALMGEPSAGLQEEFDLATDAGCTGRAYTEVGRAFRPPEFAAVIEAMDQVYWQVEDDPRVIEAQRAWRTCMADAGYPDLTEFGDTQRLVQSMVGEFRSETAGRIDSSLGETEYDAIKASVPTELAALQDEERALAVADATCREDSGYTWVHRDVTTEYEQGFIDRWRTELDAWVAFAQENRD